MQVAEFLPTRTQQLFGSFAANEQRGGCDLMLLSADPAQNDGDAPWARCYGHRFLAPDLKPIISTHADVVSIGAGSTMPRYLEAFRKVEDDSEVFMLESMMPGAPVLATMTNTTSVIEKHPQPGISPHLHSCLVRRAGVSIGRNDRLVQGHPDEDFVTPEVARSWDAWMHLLGRAGTACELAAWQGGTPPHTLSPAPGKNEGG